MKKIFAAIGGFFAKIWRWIVETAWIQPLLIVGLIFGVIFSIPSISSWINEQSENKDKYAYYNKHTIKATEVLECYENNDFSPLLEKNGADRGLLVFIEKGCSACETYEDAFKSFTTNKVWNHDGEQKTAPAVHFMYVDYDREEDKGEKQADAYFKLLDEYDFEELIQLAYLDTPNDVLGIQPSDSDWVGEDAKVRIPTPTIAYYTADGATNAIMGLEGNETPERANYIRDFYYGLNDWDL